MKVLNRIFFVTLIILLSVAIAFAMTARSIQVTLGTGATQVSSTYAPFNQMLVQNNAAHNVRLGDSTVSSTKGILIYPSGSSATGTVSGQQGDASQFYLAGTNGDVIDVLLW